MTNIDDAVEYFQVLADQVDKRDREDPTRHALFMGLLALALSLREQRRDLQQVQAQLRAIEQRLARAT